jgi:protein TonB
MSTVAVPALSTPLALQPAFGGQPGFHRRRHPATGLLIAAAHGAALWGLMHLTLHASEPPPPEPLFVKAVVEAARPPVDLPDLVKPRPTTPPPLMVVPVPEVQPLAPAPAEAPAAVAVTAPPPPAPAPVVAVAPAAEPARPAAPAQPRLLPTEAIQFIEPPEVVYPRLSKKNRETGTVVVRALIGPEGGAPRSLVVHRSSGHPRLDEAALAAVQKARFKAWLDQGRAVEAWALVPIQFELET